MKINVTTFKPSGKYYTEETVKLPVEHHHEMVPYVKQLIADRKIPGLVEGATGYHVLITSSDVDFVVPTFFPLPCTTSKD